MPKKIKEENPNHPELKQSETVIVKRSQVKFHPRNPKKHGDAAIKEQLKNFKRVGYLSGIIWNKTTGNLISGHRRTAALDLFYGNTNNHPVDFDMRVECVEMDEKQELEQLVYMDARATNTKQDYSLLAAILPDIDYKSAGLEESDLSMITIESPSFSFGDILGIKSDIQVMAGPTLEKKEVEKSARKEQVKAAKQAQKDKVEESFQGEPYVTLSFDNYGNKIAFMERFGLNIEDKFIKGELFSEQIERVS